MSLTELYSDIIEFEHARVEEYPEQVQEFVQDIISHTYTSNIEVFKYKDSNNFYIKADLFIRLPSRGNVNDIDIREYEPVLISINSRLFPYEAPSVYINRCNFPIVELPHINFFPGVGLLPSLCLHRGNFDDWFIEHSNDEFINRIRTWFSDAASNRLIKDLDEFEPTRINYYVGQMVYETKYVINLINNYWSTTNGNRGIAFFTCDIKIDDKGELYNLEIIKIVEKNKLDELLQSRKEEELIGILTWPKRNSIHKKYLSRLPKTIEDLLILGDEFDNRVNVAFNILSKKWHTAPYLVPVITVVKRPTKLIGHDSDLEFFHFVASVKKRNIHGKYSKEGKVYRFRHGNLLSINLARKLSKTNISSQPKLAIAGCGALGSKITSHLVRCGYTYFKFIDYDHLSPHNLIRHVLYHDDIGENKAKALAKRYNTLFKNESNKHFSYYPNSISSLVTNEPKEIIDSNYLCDFTASNCILNFLSSELNSLTCPIIRCEIGHEGSLGFMMIEDRNRLIKLDELRIELYAYALKNQHISNWLNYFYDLKVKHNSSEFEEIFVGLSCSSDTMPLADDVISSHASIMAYYIRKFTETNIKSGKIVINYFDQSNPTANKVFEYDVKKYINIDAKLGDWKIKLRNETYERISKEYEKNYPNETGGVFSGYFKEREKTLYIVDTFFPKNSRRGPSFFERGTDGVIEYIEEANQKTGGLLRYAGEWHTHPNGSVEMSTTDYMTLRQLSNELQNSMPAHILIFNGEDMASYITYM